jgi:FMNH2-dependent dimethyl sulfone monooxygenase
MTPANPLFSANKLKLGIFGTNGKGGAQTLVPEAYAPTWNASVRTAQMADRAGLEAIVAYARWKGYIAGKPLHPSGIVMDPFTWAAGIAQATSHAAILATSHAPTMHPIAVAKQSATIDIISGGRFGLNVVGGWNKHELEMFGAPLREHDERYDQLEEWLTIVRRLWLEEAEFDYRGRFFRVEQAISMPKPVQRNGPPIMNAGGSGRGMRFACQHADMCFVILSSDDPATCAAQIDVYKRTAREQFGRDVQVWTYAPCIQRETRQAAEDYLNHYAVIMEDRESLDAWSAGLQAQTKIVSPEQMAGFRKRFAAGAGGNILVGTARRIADQLEMLSDAGLDGVLLTWVDFIDGIGRFTADVLPLLEARGLRAPFQPGAVT